MDIKARKCPNCVGTVMFLYRSTCDLCGSELVEVEEKEEEDGH